jgi:hypothetical protein
MTSTGYRFERFQRQLLAEDFAFQGGPRPGEPFPDFELTTVDRDSISWPVVVDDVEGTLHRQLDPRPHAAYVMAPDGTVSARVLWANDASALRRALDAALSGDRTEIENRVAPVLRGTGCMYDAWDQAGGHAKTDVLKQAPPVFLSGWIARRLHPLPPLARGAVAMAATMLGPALGVAALARRRRHRD